MSLSQIKARSLGRLELLAWLNNFIESDYSKIEYLADGVAYCQIVDAVYPGKVPLRKVNLAPPKGRKDAYEKNLRVALGALRSAGMPKEVSVEKITSGNFQANYEFLQWCYELVNKVYPEAAFTYQGQTRRSEVMLASTLVNKKGVTSRGSIESAGKVENSQHVAATNLRKKKKDITSFENSNLSTPKFSLRNTQHSMREIERLLSPSSDRGDLLSSPEGVPRSPTAACPSGFRTSPSAPALPRSPGACGHDPPPPPAAAPGLYSYPSFPPSPGGHRPLPSPPAGGGGGGGEWGEGGQAGSGDGLDGVLAVLEELAAAFTGAGGEGGPPPSPPPLPGEGVVDLAVEALERECGRRLREQAALQAAVSELASECATYRATLAAVEGALGAPPQGEEGHGARMEEREDTGKAAATPGGQYPPRGGVGGGRGGERLRGRRGRPEGCRSAREGVAAEKIQALLAAPIEKDNNG